MANAPSKTTAARKPRSRVPADESKRDKFVRLATGRMNNALNTIGNLSNLSSSSYDWTPEDVTKIVTQLRSAVDQVEASFSKQSKDAEKFSL